MTAASPFQCSLLPNLESTEASSQEELIKKAKVEGILPECAIAYWRFKNKNERRSKQKGRR
jgi:hypothetical protein